MAFKKGQSGNPYGRPKGAKNKASTNLREWVERLINPNLDTIESDIRELEPAERLRFFMSLLNYALPKQRSVLPPGEEGEGFPDVTIQIVNPQGEKIGDIE